MGGLFISYRRADGGWSGRLRDHLEQRFGAGIVWWDLDDIRPGHRWREQIRRALDTAEAVLILIGPRWLTEVDAKGRKRLSKRTDMVRSEVLEALRGHAAVIPLLVGGAPMPDSSALPRSLAALTEWQAVVLNDGSWKEDVDRLLETLRGVLSKKRQPMALPDLHRRVEDMQVEYFDLLTKEPRQALNKVNETLAVLDEHLPLYPTDLRLQLQRGYVYKNQAFVQRELGNQVEYRRGLEKAQRSFAVILREAEGNLAGAYNGLGMLAVLRGRLKESLSWNEKALALVPDYSAALDDQQIVLRLINARKGSARPQRGRAARGRQNRI
jgi:tetratricopeptide (TPR) repeat protein